MTGLFLVLSPTLWPPLEDPDPTMADLPAMPHSRYWRWRQRHNGGMGILFAAIEPSNLIITVCPLVPVCEHVCIEYAKEKYTVHDWALLKHCFGASSLEVEE
jgi:hypothetical protein